MSQHRGCQLITQDSKGERGGVKNHEISLEWGGL